MAPRWDKRLRLPKSECGATICEKHEFIKAHFRDPEMSREVDQVVTQAKDDGERMEARLQELGEEANNLEDALSETEADRDRLAAELQAVRDELAASGPSCDRCQSSHCCSVAGCAPPLCVTDPEGSLPLWMPWTNDDVRGRLNAVYSQVDALQAELAAAHEEILLSRQSEGETMADLLRTRAELARVRRNHLRNQLRRAEMQARCHMMVAKQDSMSTRPQPPKRLRRAARNRDRWRKIVDAIRAAITALEEGGK